MLEIIRDDYNNPILVDNDKDLKLEIFGWGGGSVNYMLCRKDDIFKNNSIDRGDILTDEPELMKLVFESVYNYLLKKNGL